MFAIRRPLELERKNRLCLAVQRYAIKSPCSKFSTPTLFTRLPLARNFSCCSLAATTGRALGTLTGVPLDWQRPDALQIRPRDAASLSTICTQLKGRLPVLPTLTDLHLLPSLVAYRSQQFFGDPRS